MGLKIFAFCPSIILRLLTIFSLSIPLSAMDALGSSKVGAESKDEERNE
uniref:Secreted protein n=1 Tax=Heterorhabditis bacteriophora TaxID=37862 RepID=A0A1I7XJZ4_HETBA